MARVIEDKIQVFPNGHKYVTIELEPGIACKAYLTPGATKPFLGDPFTDRVGEARKSLQRSALSDPKGEMKAAYAAAYVVFIKLGYVPPNLMLYKPPKKDKQLSFFDNKEWMPCAVCGSQLVWVKGGYDTCPECEAKQ